MELLPPKQEEEPNSFLTAAPGPRDDLPLPHPVPATGGCDLPLAIHQRAAGPLDSGGGGSSYCVQLCHSLF